MTQPFSGKTYQIPLAIFRRLLFRGVGITALSVLAGFFAFWYAVRCENDPASLRFSCGTVLTFKGLLTLSSRRRYQPAFQMSDLGFLKKFLIYFPDPGMEPL